MDRIWRLGIVLALLVAVGGVACTSAEPALLRVEVSGLPHGVDGRVTIVGPENTRYTVTGSDEREVVAGTYTVKIEHVRAKRITHYPAEDQHQVKVDEGERTTTAATYRVAIPDTTKILDASDPAIVGVRGRVIHFDKSSAQAASLRVGDHLVAGEGPRIPYLLVRRVEAVTRTANRLTVDTAPATLDEALPAGVVRFDTVDGLKIVRPAAYTSTSGRAEPLAGMNFALKLDGEGCSTAQDTPALGSSIAGSISYQLDSVGLDVDGDLDWDVDTSPSVSLSAGVELRLDHSVQADIEAAIKCRVAAERDIRFGCEKVSGKILRVGPISLGCSFKIVGEASVESAATWHTGTIQTRTSLGFRAEAESDGKLSADPTLSSPLIGKRPQIPEHKSSFGATLGVEVGLEGKDPFSRTGLSIGLHITAGPKVTSSSTEFRADFGVTPKVVVDATLDAGIFDIPVPTWEIPLPKVSFTIWSISRPTPLPQPTLSSPPSPFFVGKWWGHSRTGEVRRDGTAWFAWRDYSRNDYFFIRVELALHTDGAGMAGTVTQSNIPEIRPGSPVRLKRVIDQYQIQLLVEDTQALELLGPFCNNQAPPGHCGA